MESDGVVELLLQPQMNHFSLTARPEVHVIPWLMHKPVLSLRGRGLLSISTVM